MYRFVIAVCVLAVIACSDAHVVLPEGTEPLSDDIAATVTKLKAERIEVVVESFVRKNNRFPDDAEFAEIAAGPPGESRAANDQWGTPFRLDRDTAQTAEPGRSWAIRSAGADKQFNTDDDVSVLGVLGQP